MKTSSRIQVSEDVAEAAGQVARAASLSTPRVLGCFARHGMAAGAAALLAPLGLSLESLAKPQPAAAPRPRRGGTQRKGQRI